MKDEKPKIEYPFHSDEFYQCWNRWKQYKKEEWRFYYKSAISEQSALDDLKKLSNGNEHTAIDIIGQSLAKGWQGLFPIKNNNNGHSQFQRPARKTNEQATRELLAGGGEMPDFLKGQ